MQGKFASNLLWFEAKSSKTFLTTNKSVIMYSYLVACGNSIFIVIQGQIGQLGQAQGLLGIYI